LEQYSIYFYIGFVIDIENDKIKEKVIRHSVTPSNITEPSGSNKKNTSKSDLNSSGIKVVRCSEQSLDNVDAAIFNAENVLKSIKKSPINPKSSMLKDLYLSNTVKIVSKDDVIASYNKGKKSRDEENSIKKKTPNDSSRLINNDN